MKSLGIFTSVVNLGLESSDYFNNYRLTVSNC